MAKSMRSKWKKKMTAVKRVKVDEKVKVRLLQKIAKNIAEKKEEMSKIIDDQKNLHTENMDDVEMQDAEKKYNSRTLLDKNGLYPKWMNQRAIKKMKKKQKDLKKQSK